MPRSPVPVFSTPSALGPRFEFHVGLGPQWTAADEILTGDLADLLAAHARSRGTDNLSVAASLLVSEYAGWLVRPLLWAHHETGASPDPSPGHVGWRVESGRLTAVAHDGTLLPAATSASELTSRLTETHLAPLIAHVRAHAKISSRTLWGNVAGSLAAAYRLMSWRGTDPDRYADDLAALCAGPPLRGLCEPTCLPAADRHWLVPQRRTCCLAYQCGDGSYCASCSLLGADEHATRHLDLITTHLKENR